MKYTIVEGDIPKGLTLNENSGLLEGVTDYENLSLGPIWETASGNLGVFDEKQAVTLAPLQVSLREDTEFSRFSLVKVNVGSNSSGLPWGLVLDGKTGVIAGTINDLLDPLAPPFIDDEFPVWSTPSGRLGSYGESELVDLQLETQAQGTATMKRWFVVKGGLPWGLVLNGKTGTITGTTAPKIFMTDPEDIVEAPPGPIWQTPSGALGFVQVGETSTITLRANPRSGTTVTRFMVVAGGLPWGLTLNKTGVITGKLARLYNARLEDLFDNPAKATWAPAELVSGVAATPPSGTDLGSYLGGSTISIKLGATPRNNASLQKIFLSQTAVLPWGLTLNKSGVISGTLRPVPETQAYSFTVVAVDSLGIRSPKTYKLTVLKN